MCPAVDTQCPATNTACPATATQCPPVATQCPPVDLPDLVVSPQITGVIRIRGTALMKAAIDDYATAFKVLHPNVQFDVSLKGSDEGIPALIAGTADLAVMDRGLTDTETNNFNATFGVAPADFQAAVDSMAIVVQKGNPLGVSSAGLTLAQLDAIFSKTLKRGNAAVMTWGDLGVTDPAWATQAIKPYYRPDSEPTYLSTVMLDGGQLKNGLADPGVGTHAHAGRPAMAIAAAQDANAIQLVPRWYLLKGLKDGTLRAVPLVDDKGNKVAPLYTSVISGTYPLGAVLTFKAVKTPTQPLSPAVKEFLSFVLSKPGQKIVPKNGFGRLPVPTVIAERKQLE